MSARITTLLYVVMLSFAVSAPAKADNWRVGEILGVAAGTYIAIDLWNHLFGGEVYVQPSAAAPAAQPPQQYRPPEYVPVTAGKSPWDTQEVTFTALVSKTRHGHGPAACQEFQNDPVHVVETCIRTWMQERRELAAKIR